MHRTVGAYKLLFIHYPVNGHSEKGSDVTGQAASLQGSFGFPPNLSATSYGNLSSNDYLRVVEMVSHRMRTIRDCHLFYECSRNINSASMVAFPRQKILDALLRNASSRAIGRA